MNFFKSVFQFRKPEEDASRMQPAIGTASAAVQQPVPGSVQQQQESPQPLPVVDEHLQHLQQKKKKRFGSISRSFSSHHHPLGRYQKKSHSKGGSNDGGGKQVRRKSRQREMSRSLNVLSPEKTSSREGNKSFEVQGSSVAEGGVKTTDPTEKKGTPPNRAPVEKQPTNNKMSMSAEKTMDDAKRTIDAGEKNMKTQDEARKQSPAAAPAVVDDAKPKKIKLPRKKKNPQASEEQNTDFEKVAVPSRPAVASTNREKRSAAAMMAETQARLARQEQQQSLSQMPVDATFESPPQSEFLAGGGGENEDSSSTN